MCLCLLVDVIFKFPQKLVIMVNKREIHLNALSDTFIPEPLSDPFPVALITDALVKCGEIVLMIGVLDMGKQFGSFSS